MWQRGGFSHMRQSRERRIACDGNYGVVNVKKTENTGFLCELLKTYSRKSHLQKDLPQTVFHCAVESLM